MESESTRYSVKMSGLSSTIMGNSADPAPANDHASLLLARASEGALVEWDGMMVLLDSP